MLGALMTLDFAAALAGRTRSENKSLAADEKRHRIKIAFAFIPLAVALAAKGLGQDWSYLVSFAYRQ